MDVRRLLMTCAQRLTGGTDPDTISARSHRRSNPAPQTPTPRLDLWLRVYLPGQDDKDVVLNKETDHVEIK